MTKYVNLIQPLASRMIPLRIQENLQAYDNLMSHTLHVPTGAVTHLSVDRNNPDTPLLGVAKDFYNCKGIYFSSSLSGSPMVEASLVHYNEHGNSHGSLMEAIQRHHDLQARGYETTVKIVNNVSISDQSGIATYIAAKKAEEEVNKSLTDAGFSKTEKLFVGESNFVVSAEGKAISRSPTSDWLLRVLQQSPEEKSRGL